MRLADQSAREVVPSVACLECDLETSKMRRPRAHCGCGAMKNVFPYWDVLCSQMGTEIC